MRLKYSKNPTCPQPFPGESLHSVLTRNYRYYSDLTLKEYSKSLTENAANLTLNFHNPENLTYPTLFEDFDKACDHTTIAYYLSALTLDQQYIFLERIKRHDRVFPWPLTPSCMIYPRKNKRVFYCPRCLVKDTQDYGIPYFHTAHQVPGITACPWHGTNLRILKQGSLSLLSFEEKARGVPSDERDFRIAKLSQEFCGLYQERLFYIYHKKIFNPLSPKGQIEHQIYQKIYDNFGKRWLKRRNITDLSKVMNLERLASSVRFYLYPFYHLLLWDCFGLHREDFL